MRLLLINKYHFLKGGTDKVYLDEIELWRAAGHEVHVFAMRHPRNLPAPADEGFFVSEVNPASPGGVWEAARAAGRLLYSFEARRRLTALIRRHGPFDAAHLHNIYHQLSPSILGVLKRHAIPAAMTLHDYKLVCGTYSLLNRGEICERCTGGNTRAILQTRCNSGSLLRSSLTFAEMTLHHKVLNLYKAVDIMISPSHFLKDKVQAMGFHGRIEVISNPVAIPPAPVPYTQAQANQFVFTGRLSREKGVDLLLRALTNVPLARLRICGGGPELEALKLIALQLGVAPQVTFLGPLPHDKIAAELAQAQALVQPSRWHEDQPLSVLEAFAAGRPVIGSDFGGLPELINTAGSSGAGKLFRGGSSDDLSRALIEFIHLPDERKAAMGVAGREFVIEHHAPEKHLASLLNLFEQLRHPKAECA